MALESIPHDNGASQPDEVEKQQVPSGNSYERTKATRHPRWTRQETYVLIEGKRVVENEVQKGRRSSSVLGSDHHEPKWESVSSYCRHRGVSRGPVQCRKRWSNLLVDFKKIMNWESQIKGEAESFWKMRNDARRVRRLPGFFDREVYDVLDGKAVAATAACPVALMIPLPTDAKNGDGVEEAAAEEEDEDEDEEEPVKLDLNEDGPFSDFEESGQEETAINSKKENTMRGSPTKTVTTPVPASGTMKEKRSLGSNTWREFIYQEKWKQRRLSTDGCEENYSDRLIRVLERNSNMLNAQLEAQNKNCQLDRDQRKEQNNTLLAALGKVADALVRIADKL